jgi:hypothetical protein
MHDLMWNLVIRGNLLFLGYIFDRFPWSFIILLYIILYSSICSIFEVVFLINHQCKHKVLNLSQLIKAWSRKSFLWDFLFNHIVWFLFRQIIPYQKENNNLVKISSADLFGQIVIWNVNDGRIHQTSSITNHIQNRFHLNDGTTYTNGQTR